MKSVLDWVFPNQFSQEGAVASPPLRAQLCLRNYYLCVRGGLEPEIDAARKLRILEHVLNSLNFSEVFGNEQLVTFGELEKLAKRETKLKIFTFGSLLHPISAKFNLKGKGKASLAFGLKRLFNYFQEDLEENRLGLPSPENSDEMARLNVAFTSEISDMLPGALFEVDACEIASLKIREKGYHWKRVLIVDYEAIEKGELPEVEEAYTLILPQGEENSEALPHQSYLNICLEGAKQFGTRFLKFFSETTYLADGKTTILEWLRNEVITMNLELIPLHN